MKTAKVPKGALRFVEEGFHAFAINDDDKPPRIQMTAYNGKVIKGHWYWGDLAIDLSGMKFAASKFPILENHDTDKKIGFHNGRPDISENKLELIPEKTRLVDTEAANEFVKLSSDGFPYQASIYAKPTEIQRLEENETTDVNGFSFKGPGTVWRKCEFKEASVCVFGWDSTTRSSAFSREVTEDVEYIENAKEVEDTSFAETEDNHTEEGGENMNLEELKAKYPDLFAQFADEVKAEMEKVFAKEREKFTAEKSDLEKKLGDSDKRLADLEKKDALREEREREATADRIWSAKLSESDIADHMFDKVKRMVSFTKFVKDDELDVDAFSTAIDEEIKDWESRLSKQTVSGLGSVARQSDGESANAATTEQNQKLTNDLLSRAGQEVTA